MLDRALPFKIAKPLHYVADTHIHYRKRRASPNIVHPHHNLQYTTFHDRPNRHFTPFTSHRMNKERRPSVVHNWKPTEKRPVGRSNQRWLNNIEKDLKRAGLSLYGITTGRNRVRLEELVGDRERWKDITAASMEGQAFSTTT